MEWKNGFEQWQLKRHDVPKDGHCLFHAICLAFFKPYIEESFNGMPISRLQIIKNLRHELAEKLKTPIHKYGRKYYDLLNHGNTSKFSMQVPEFKLQYMMNELDSNHAIGYGYLEFIGNEINKDIFILNGDTQDLYYSDEYQLTIKNRNAIVLYYQNNHYELISIDNITHFKSDHPFILFLKTKLK